MIFRVRDTGPGIPTESQKRIFEEFRQADDSFNRPRTGTGLGLAISRELAQLLGGQLELVESHAGGSLFQLTVPVEEIGGEFPSGKLRWQPSEGEVAEFVELLLDKELLDAAAPDLVRVENGQIFRNDIVQQGTLCTWRLHRAAVRDSDETPGHDKVMPKTKGLRILLAEDNPINGKILSVSLENRDFRVSWEKNGHDVVALQIREPHDIILMDLQMPGLDGLEACAAIREHEKKQGLKEVPIVALTARTHMGDRSEDLTSKMTDFLVKPVAMRDLIETIERHISERQ